MAEPKKQEQAAFAPVNPSDTEKKLSVGEYEKRREITTALELNNLLKSDDLKHWAKNSRRPSFGGKEICLSIVPLLLLLGCGAYLLQRPHRVDELSFNATAMHEETLAANQQRLLEVSMVAEQLAGELRAREDAMTKQAAKMSKQADEVTQLQQSLWSAEEELTQLIERTATDQSLVPFLEASNRTQTASPKSPKPSWEILLPYLPAIAAGTGLLALLALANQRLLAPRRNSADDNEVEELRKKLKAITSAKAEAEKQVFDLHANLAEKASELTAAYTERKQAEEKAADTQQSLAALQTDHETPGFDLTKQALAEKEQLLEELSRLKDCVEQRDAELSSLNQEINDLSEKLPREIQRTEEAMEQMRGSLETAQGRLHFMQGELSIRERECQQLKEKLEEQQRCENDLKEALEAAEGREDEMRRELHLVSGEAKARVASVMELMKSQRIKLSQKLLQSQQYSSELASALAEARRTEHQDSPANLPKGKASEAFRQLRIPSDENQSPSGANMKMTPRRIPQPPTLESGAVA